MKRLIRKTFMTSVLVLAITGCMPVATPTPLPVIQPETTDTDMLNRVKASAVVVPAQESRLSFVMSGMVEDVIIEVGDQVQAEQVLVTLDTTELEFDIIAAEAALKSAEIEAQIRRERRRKFDLDNFSFVYVSAPAEKILEADSVVAQMRSALEAAEATLAQGILAAPFDSTVVAVDVSPGEYVRPGQVIIELAKLNDLQIETTDLSELNIAAVEVGQPATVYVEALDEEFPGEVTAISPISDTIGGDVVFEVTIQLNEQPRELLWGMSAEVEIDVE